MEDEKRLLYAIWLNQSCGHNPALVHRLLKKYKTPEEIFRVNHYDSSFYKLLHLGRVLQMDQTLESAKRFLEHCQKQEILVLDMGDARYPNLLKQVSQPPTLLYAKGKLPDLNRMLGVSVVGTRKCSEDGEKAAEMLGRTLAESGAVIVSGMAKGIDGAAHCGALEAGGTTLAVLAGGVDNIYPTEHTDLYRHILEHGAILSEQPPGSVGKPYFYRQRNRIIVGLSRGVIVVEGEVKSGTSISARLATENDRDIFAVPGNPMNVVAALPNELIRDGAKQVTGPLDVLEEYLTLYPEELAYGIACKGRPVTGRVLSLNHASEQKSASAPSPTGQKEPQKTQPTEPTSQEYLHQLEELLKTGEFRPEEERILRYLCERAEVVSFEDLAENCGLETGMLSSMLIILQMKQTVLQSAGSNYRIHFGTRKA